jgi:cardiolipin synthase
MTHTQSQLRADRSRPGGCARPMTVVLRLVVLAWAGLVAHGCATLPDAERELAKAPAETVRFESGEGPVSERRSDAIVERLEGGAGDSELLDRHLAYEQQINADSPLVLGNRLTLLENGPATYASMFEAIRGAKDHINLETYIFEADETGVRFADLLLERQAAGVQVNVIYDSVGGIGTPKEFFDRLRAGGVAVLEFNPVNPLARLEKGWRLNQRDHRKQLIVDGRVVFTGGINISSTYASAPRGKSGGSGGSSGSSGSKTVGWRDTHVRIEGPVVAEFQKLFMETWQRQKGEPLAQKNYFPEVPPAGKEIVRAIGSTPDDEASLIYLTLMSAIAHAEREVHITMAYFAPDEQLLQALVDAVGRGVDVTLILPSYSDSTPIFHLGRSYYTTLLRGGVRIFERRGAIMHAKTACIDGVWSTIGSTNLDMRSFLHNDEINAVMLSREFAARMEAMFDADLAESDEVTLEQWKRRPLGLRIKERLARLGAYWM